MLGLVTQSALAAGTTAATSITNSATLSYSVATVAQTNIVATSTAFLVDEKIDLTVAGTGVAIPVVPGSTSQVATFTVTNNSNSPLDFSLAANQPVGGAYLALTDNFDATGCGVFVETAGGAGYQAASDTTTFIDELAADATATVYAVCNIPAARVNGDAAIVGLTATARGDFTTAVTSAYAATATTLGAVITQTAGADTVGVVDIVFADIAGTEAGDAARDAKHSARDVYSVVTATLGVTKSAAVVCDPFNGLAASNAKNIPGSITQWTLTISNTGAAAATLSTITDSLTVAQFTMDPGAAAGLNIPASAATCVPGAGPYGFKVTVPVARVLGGSAAGSNTVSYFTTTTTADGIDFASPTITATFATILPIDGATGHASAGLLNAGESVTIIFNTVVQ